MDQVNAGRPVCPVGLNTLVIPRKNTMDNEKQQPYVYLNCGHVQGHHDWGQEKDSNSRCCPMCLKVNMHILYTIFICFCFSIIQNLPGCSDHNNGCFLFDYYSNIFTYELFRFNKLLSLILFSAHVKFHSLIDY